MMKPNKLKAILLLLGTSFCNVYADTYKFDVGALYNVSQSDDKTNTDGVKIAGTYYFNPVEIDSKKPFNELGFLQRKTNFSLSYEALNYEDFYFSQARFPVIGISAKLYDGNFVINLKRDAWHESLNLKVNSQQSYDQKNEALSLSYGYFFKENTLVSLEVNRDKRIYSPSPGLTAIADTVWKSNGVTSHSVMSLKGDQFIVLDLALRAIKSQRRDAPSIQGNTEASIQVQYYPSPRYYVLGGLSLNQGDDAYYVGKTPALGLGYAYTSSLSLTSGVRKFYSDDVNKGPNNKSIYAAVNYKF